MFWSDACASFGLGALCFFCGEFLKNARSEEFPTPFVQLAVLLGLTFIPGGCFGAAVGKLIQRTHQGVEWGMRISFVLMVLFAWFIIRPTIN